MEEKEADFVIFACNSMPVHNVMYFLLDNNIQYRILLGSWENEKEVSYIIEHDRLKDIMLSGLLDDEDAILLLGPNVNSTRTAHIHTLKNNEVKYVGIFKSVPRIEAEKQSAWSYDPHSKAFFIVEPKQTGEIDD